MLTKFIPFLFLSIVFVFCKKPKATKPIKSIDALPIEIPKKAIIQYDYDTTLWTDIAFVDTTILLDLKYATTDNFVEEKMYNCGRCFLRPKMAQLILAAHKDLQKEGLGLKLFDCYRPKPVQEKLWKKVPNPNYVTPPSKGSMHNRGVAIDLTIVDEKGIALDMGTAYDYFGVEAHHTYTQHTKEVANNRTLLKNLMGKYQLKPIRTEWWHYSYQGKSYPISEMLWNCK